MSTLHSPRWHRVAELRPRLSPLLQLRRQRLRGERWMLLADPAGGRSVRLNASAYALAAHLDGQRSLQQLWDWQLAQPGDPATQDEIIGMLAQLREAALVQLEATADFDRLLPHLQQVAAPRGRRSLLAWRIPLADPSRLLDRLQGLAPLLFSRTAALLWALALALLIVLTAQNAPELWAHGQRWLATPRFALLAALLYVPIKLVHELAHGLAVRRWGGTVHEAGVTLMLGLPVPYVDASAATAFVQRRQRVIVSAAGIMAELAIAALSLSLWLWLGDGWARDAAFVALTITGVSTLLFNANPLQRLDGYFIATDLLQLPNLATRSRAWWLDRLQRGLLRLPDAEPMAVARGETPWLAAYAPLSWAWGGVVAALAVAWLGHLSLVLGLSAAALLAWQLGLRPALTLFGQLRRTALACEGPTQRWRRLVLGGGVAVVVLLALPLPQRLMVQGVVWPPDQAQLRAQEDGFVAHVFVTDGQFVQAGDVVLELANPTLNAGLASQQARVQALEAALFDAQPGHGAAAGDSRAELTAAQAELQRLSDRRAALALRAETAGRVALPQASDLPGQYVRRGRLLGQVLGSGAGTVRMALPEADARLLRQVATAAGVRLASAPGTLRQGTLVRDAGGATLQLPSAALSARHGGSIATDPQDPDDLRPLQPVVVLDLRLEAEPAAGRGVAERAGERIGERMGERMGERIGERAWVRLDAGFAPLGVQAALALQQQVRQRFNPQF